MGRHRKNPHSVVWDYVNIYAGYVVGGLGLIIGAIL